MSILDLEIGNNTVPNYNNLAIWYNDYTEVSLQVQQWLSECTVLSNAEEMIYYITGRMHYNNAYSICSDTHEPLEYIDFNYKNIACTISIYDRTEPELLPCFDGYIRRDGEELADCYMDISIDEIEIVINNRKDV